MHHNKQLVLIKKYIDETKFDEALAMINQCIVINPQSKENYLIRGEIYYLLREYTNALNDFTKVLQLDPNAIEAKLKHGIVYHAQQGLKDSALIDFLNQIIESDPENAMAYYFRARTYKRMNQQQNALADFDKAIQLAPEEASYHHSRGLLYFAQRRYEDAIVNFNRSIDLNPNVASFFNNRGNCYFSMKKFELALQDFNKSIEINPDSGSQVDRAVAALKLGNYALAFSDYYYYDENDLDDFLICVRNNYPAANTNQLLTNYHKVKNVTNKYQLNIPQALALLKAEDFAKYWLLQTWRQLVTGKDINNQNVALSNNTPTLPAEIYRLITSFIIECADGDLDKLVWATNKRLHDDVIDAHNKKFGVKLSNSANKFLTLFKVKTTPDNFQQIAEERFNRRLDF